MRLNNISVRKLLQTKAFHAVVASGAYEKACVLFNLAALSVAVAQQQNLQNDEGLKTSAKLFQVSSLEEKNCIHPLETF